MSDASSLVPAAIQKSDVEEGHAFLPRFDADGLIPAIVSEAENGSVLMFAWMNAEALERTMSTGQGHFWSRSRKRLWRKGEESGNILMIEDIRTDCDQDVLWLRVRVAGDGAACHTARRTCFYRTLRQVDGKLVLQHIDERAGRP